jgi:hypothetical protein
MITKEPVAITAAVALLAQAGAAALLPRAPAEVHIAVATVVTGVVAWIARRFAFSENTIREAGFDPAAVEARAADPSVPRCTKGERKPTPGSGQ